jgi:hypothetical protein
MCDSSSEFRHRLAADRMAALRRCAEHGPPSSLRRAVGSGLVRLGLWLRSDGRVPPLVTSAGPPATVGPSVASSRTGEVPVRDV